MHDFKRNKWDLGDMGGIGTSIYDNSSLVRLDPTVQVNEYLQFSVIVSGGYDNGTISDSVRGIRFLEQERGGQKYLIGDTREFLTPLTTPRYLHQSVVVKREGLWHLYVVGGKTSNTDKGWLNSIESLDLTGFLFPYLREERYFESYKKS